MANFLTTFSQREILTASKLNDIVNLVNDHERRLLAQKITAGTGYTFTQSQGGTSLQITPHGGDSGDETSSSPTPFRVSLIKGNFDGFNYAVSATSGTIFGTSGTSSSYDYIDASDDDHDNEANCKLYTYVNLSEGEWLVHAVLYVEATSWGLMNNYGGGSGDGDGDDGGDGDDVSALAGIVSTCIPFRCEFQWIDAERLDEWQADARGEIGWKIVGGEALDDYGLGYTYEVHFPMAIITMKSGNNGLSASITQLLHSDIFWNGHKTFSA